MKSTTTKTNSVIKRAWCCLALVVLLIGAMVIAQGPSANYDESKVGSYTLPDPLVFNNGKPVRTASDWIKRRRQELLELFAQNMFGRSPQPPKSIKYNVFDTDKHSLGGKAVRKQVTNCLASERMLVCIKDVVLDALGRLRTAAEHVLRKQFE